MKIQRLLKCTTELRPALLAKFALKLPEIGNIALSRRALKHNSIVLTLS